MPFVMEVRELTGTLLARVDDLENASASWIQNTAAADRELSLQPDLDQASLADSLRSQVHDQTRIFDSLEALLAGWARLSLLLFPSSRKEPGSEFRMARGDGLRTALGVNESSVFANRELRDAWMHFDERLDAAVSSGTFGNRHSFVRSERVRDYINNTLRLMEVDTLVLHYRNRRGEARSADLRTLRRELLELGAAAERARRG